MVRFPVLYAELRFKIYIYCSLVVFYFNLFFIEHQLTMICTTIKMSSVKCAEEIIRLIKAVAFDKGFSKLPKIPFSVIL